MLHCCVLDGRRKSRLALIESSQRPGWSSFTFCFHDHEEVGPAALAKIGKDTGLRPEDL
jgi:hypothetical protein